MLDGVLVVRLRRNRCTPAEYVSSWYSAAEIDAVCAYSPQLHRGFLIPVDEIADRSAIHLRLDPPRNNQTSGVKWAYDYELAAMIDRLRATQSSTASPATLA